MIDKKYYTTVNCHDGSTWQHIAEHRIYDEHGEEEGENFSSWMSFTHAPSGYPVVAVEYYEEWLESDARKEGKDYDPCAHMRDLVLGTHYQKDGETYLLKIMGCRNHRCCNIKTGKEIMVTTSALKDDYENLGVEFAKPVVGWEYEIRCYNERVYPALSKEYAPDKIRVLSIEEDAEEPTLNRVTVMDLETGCESDMWQRTFEVEYNEQ